MAILVIVHGRGIKKQDYDRLQSEMGWDQSKPTGLALHASGTDDNGDVHVADIWESPDDFNNFAASRLMPAFQKLNLPFPDVGVYPVHKANALDAVDQYKG